MKQFKYLYLAILGSITLLATQSATYAGEFACKTPTQSYSDRTKMEAGDASANVYWKDVKYSANSVGYGPAAEHEFEITIVDGKVYMAKPDGDTVLIRNQPKPEEGAMMLQISTPESWGMADPMAEISSFDDLAFELDTLVDDLGCGEDVLMPFKIVGHASRLVWSMDTEPVNKVTEEGSNEVVIVGIHNRANKDKTFMVRGYNIHAHVLMPATGFAGHLRDLELDEGAKLYLPGS